MKPARRSPGFARRLLAFTLAASLALPLTPALATEAVKPGTTEPVSLRSMVCTSPSMSLSRSRPSSVSSRRAEGCCSSGT